MPKKEKIIFIAVHPDDETLGAGGTILKRRMEGCQNYWLIITGISVEAGWDISRVKQRDKEIKKVASLYGFKETIRLEFPTTKLDTIPSSELIQHISKAFMKIKPARIYLPHPYDIHSDHRAAYFAAISASKTFRYPSIKKILSYECPSESEYSSLIGGASTTFNPNVFEDISGYFRKKTEIFKIYHSEVMSPPGPRSIRSIEALASWRGARIMCDYAEAFNLLFEKV